MAWTVDFFEYADGSAPVEAFLDGLPKKQRAKLLGRIDKLREHGPTLPFPYSSQVEGKVRELRTRFGKTRLRILYFGDANQEFKLLHGVVKDTEKLEKFDLQEAKDRMADHNRRVVKKEELKKRDTRVKGE
jgi:phage-related protein